MGLPHGWVWVCIVETNEGHEPLTHRIVATRQKFEQTYVKMVCAT
jgi:hypothetical protein